MKPSNLILSGELELPPEAVTETFALLAARRAGKTNGARVMAEEMFREHLPFVAIDPVGSWHGLRSSRDGRAPGLPIPIFGGRYGDVPLEQTGGQLIADLIVDTNLSCVLDVSQFESESAKKRFLLDFARRLYQRNETPRHLFLEEADDYIRQQPQRDEAQLLRAWENIVRRGGQRGLGCTVLTQRSASINKHVLTQVGTLIALRTTGPQDRAAIGLWLEHHAQSDEILASLPGLKDGEAWVWSPHFLGVTKRFQFRLSTTFDSGATPKVGVTRKVTTLADVDLGAVKAQMAATIVRAQATDPKALLARIADLERQLKARPTVTTVAKVVSPRVKVQRVEVPVVTPRQQRQLDRIVGNMLKIVEWMQDGSTRFEGYGQDLAKTVGGLKQALKPPDPTPVAVPPNPRRTLTVKNRSPHAILVHPSGAIHPEVKLVLPLEGNLGAGPLRMLQVLAAFLETGLTKNQLGVLSVYPAAGSTFRTYVPQLKRSGLVEDGSGDRFSYDCLRITDAGLKVVGGAQDPPIVSHVLDAWRARLGAGEVKMLDALVAEYPGAISREQLGEVSGYPAHGSTFRTYLPKLHRKGLVEYQAGGLVGVSPDVYFGRGQ